MDKAMARYGTMMPDRQLAGQPAPLAITAGHSGKPSRTNGTTDRCLNSWMLGGRQGD